MSKEKIYAKGIKIFPKHPKSPSFVKGTVVITPNELNEWLKENSQYMSEYSGNKQIKFQLLENDKGLYFQVDTYKKETSSNDPF